MGIVIRQGGLRYALSRAFRKREMPLDEIPVGLRAQVHVREGRAM